MSATVEFDFERAPAAARSRLTLTERHWLLALAFLVGGLVIATAAGGIEKDLVHHGGPRVFKHTSLLFTSLMGIPHFLLGAAFAWTSVSMRSTFARRRWIFFGVVGIGLCFGYERMLGWNGLLGTVALTGYFLVHDLRDQIEFYLAVGDAPTGTDRRTISRILAPLFIFGFGLVVALAAVLMIVGVPGYEEPRQRAFERLGDLAWMLWALPTALLLGPALLLRRRLGAGTLSELREFLRTHRPIAVVYAGVLLVMLTGLITGHRASLIAIMHAMTWYIFARWRLRNPASRPATAGATAVAAPSAPRPWTWNWVRRTTPGFATAHFGVALVLLLAAVGGAWMLKVDVQHEGPLYAFLSQRSFEFWTIVHITTSFRPGG